MKTKSIIGAAVVGLAGVAARDLTQKKHSLKRNFPVIAHARYCAGEDRAGAAAVHHHEQRRGASVLTGPALVGLREQQEGEQLRRVRDGQRRREPRGLRHRQAPDVRPVGAVDRRGARTPRRRGRAPGCQGPRRTARQGPRLPARLGRQRLRDELRRRCPATRSSPSTEVSRWPVPSTTPARAVSPTTTATAAISSSRSERPTSGAATSRAGSTSPGSRTSWRRRRCGRSRSS